MGSRSPRRRSRSRTQSPPRRAASPARSPARGRSPSRSRSRSRSESPRTESITITDEDAAFILGRGGSTKNKLARVSGARLELDDKGLRLDIIGTTIARRRAREYVGFVMSQRVGQVKIDTSDPRPDLSVVEVPDDCLGYIMGKQGSTLRGIEDEWGTLMFFAKLNDGPEKLAIFGTRRARRGAELKVMSAVEHKHPGHFVDSQGRLRERIHQAGDDDGDDWDYETVVLGPDEFSYALGAGGATRRKLARAADCIMEYVGSCAVIAGFRDERRRGRDYLTWLLTQRRGIVQVDTRSREDVTTVEVPREAIGFITGHKGESLREVERQTGTFIFSDGERSGSGGRSNPGFESILIFGASKAGRKDAKRRIEERLRDSQYRDRSRGGGGGGGGGDRRGGGGGGGGSGGGYDRRDDRGGRDDRDRGGRDRDSHRDDRERDSYRRRSRSRSRDRRRSRSRSR